MALDKSGLKNGIQTLLGDMRTRDVVSDDEFATRLSDLIDVFIKSGDGVYQTGTLKAGSVVVAAAPTIIVKIQ